MHVASTPASEVRMTLDATVSLVNGLDVETFDIRSALADRAFSRAANASAASIERLHRRLNGLAPLLRSLPDTDEATVRARVNEELVELPVTPSIVEHDGADPHLHWTPNTATFDDQVLTDILMALAQELVENGTIRFGRCGAADCERLFFDGTRNRSRRFCDDARCASRTHTADHRARKSNRN